MALGSQINQVSQIGVETTPGTVVPCTRRLLAAGIDLSYQMDTQDIRPQGYKISTAHPLNKEWSSGKFDGGFAFNEVQYPLASVMSKATPTPILAGVVYANSTAYALGAIVRPTTPNGNRYVVTVAGTSGTTEPAFPTAPGSTVVSGTVTFKQAGADVVAHEWIFEMSTTGKDNIQTYTVEQLDSVRNRAVRAAYCYFSSFKLSSKRSDKVSVSSQLMGQNLVSGITPSTGAVEQTIVPGTTSMVNVYLDTTSAALGTTQLTQNFAFDCEVSDRFQVAWLHNRANASWNEHVEKEPKVGHSITIADDIPFDNVVANMRKGQRMFARFEIKGLEVEPNSGVFYTFQWDIAGQVRDQPDLSNTDGAYTAKLNFDAEHDGTWGRGHRMRLINKNSAL
ncbi:MAG: hypothetical protein M3P49_13160 [Actinomycetota bacterium]|nr:hypothetical protein [Actinomycetota bacterium]